MIDKDESTRPTPPEPVVDNAIRWFHRAYALADHCWARMVRLRATGMAAELTYRTLFALIPLTVLGLVLFRVVGGLETVQTRVEDQLFAFFGVPDVTYEGHFEDEPEGPEAQLLPPETPTAGLNPGDRVPLEAIASGAAPANLDADGDLEEIRAQATIRRTLKGLTDKVTNIDFASLGVVGLLLFIYAAVGLTDSVEADFNLVCENQRHRPWHLRMAIHWSILTIGSGLLAMSLYVADLTVEWVGGHGGSGMMQGLLSRLLAFVAGWMLLFFLYAWMPNTRIDPKCALMGSLVAAILWEGAKRGFQIYVSTTQPYANLYGSLGLLPVFFFWVYITWMLVLFGLFLTYSWQNYPGHLPTGEEQREADHIVPDSAWSLPVLLEIARAFRNGVRAELPLIADQLRLPPGVVRRLTTRLKEEGYIHQLSQSPDCFALAFPPDRIEVNTLLHDVANLPEFSEPQSNPSWLAFERMQRQQIAVADGLTLEDLLQESPSIPIRPRERLRS